MWSSFKCGLPHLTLSTIGHAFWALCGAVVFLFILLAALGAVDPWAAEVMVPVLVLAALWLGHAWRELWHYERGPR